MWGEPLEPDERVVYFCRPSRTGARLFMFILGFPMIMMFGLGIYLIYLAITDRKQAVYAQAITNRRLLAMDGHGKIMFSIRWPEVAGLNKVSRNGVPTSFGVRNRAGVKFMFTDDLNTVERIIQRCVDVPSERETSREAPFEPAVL
jgi:hypothetical protein